MENLFWAADHVVETAGDLECAESCFAIRTHPSGAFAFEASRWECWILGGDAVAGYCDLSFRDGMAGQEFWRWRAGCRREPRQFLQEPQPDGQHASDNEALGWFIV